MATKRRHDEIECNNDKHQKNKLKKTRKDKICTSTLFKDIDDQEQFQNIHKAIESCQLTQILAIPHEITRSIGEYATGDWRKCRSIDTIDCDELVSVLNEDDGKYECISCKNIVWDCYCDFCDKVWVSSESVGMYECRICNDANYCSDCDFECAECGNGYCTNCGELCEGCGEITYCSHCVKSFECFGKCTICGSMKCVDECIGIGTPESGCICKECINKHPELFKHYESDNSDSLDEVIIAKNGMSLID